MKTLSIAFGLLASIPLLASAASAQPLCFMQKADGTMMDLTAWCTRNADGSTPANLQQPSITTSAAPKRDRSSDYLIALKRGLNDDNKDWVDNNQSLALQAGRDYCSARSSGMRKQDYEKTLENNLYTEEAHQRVVRRAVSLAPIYFCPEYR